MTRNLKNKPKKHTFFERKLDRKNINIKYQCIICIQFYATESDITVVVFGLIIQIMYSPANRVFFFLKMQRRWRWYHPDHVHTMYPSTLFTRNVF